MRRSGKHAFVDGICCTQGWTLNGVASVSRYAASCVPGGTATSEGNEDWTGTITGVGGIPPLPDGDEIPFLGIVSPEDPILNYGAVILLQDTTLTLPIAAGTVITWSSNFGVQGEPTAETVTPYYDECREPGPSAAKAKIAVEQTLEGNNWIDIEEVQTATLTFRRPHLTSVSSGLTYREAGNLEVDLNFQVNNDDLLESLYGINQIKRVRVYINETEFYEFDAIHFSEHSNFQVIREPFTIVNYTVNGLWTALRQQSPPALGTILLPNGATWYGEGST